MKDNSKPRTTCPRCGMDVAVNLITRHHKVCQKLPLPIDLAREYLADETINITHLCHKYLGYQSKYLKARLTFGLTLLGEEDATTLAARRAQPRPPRLSEDEIPDGMERCSRCGLAFARMDTHIPGCEALPTPEELAREFLDNGLTLSDVRNAYTGQNSGSLPVGLRDRLSAGLLRLGIDEDALVLSRQHQARRSDESRMASGKRPRVAYCRSCGVRLDVAPEGKGEVCGWCRDPLTEYSRTAVTDGETAVYEVEATVDVNGRQRRVTETITAATPRMAARGLSMRLRAKYGEQGRKWDWAQSPTARPCSPNSPNL